jgi:hypothetical protein
MARPKKKFDVTRMTHAELDELEKKIAASKKLSQSKNIDKPNKKRSKL